jgi:hypothetical protein
MVQLKEMTHQFSTRLSRYQVFVERRDTFFRTIGEYMERHLKPIQYQEWELCMSRCNYAVHQYMEELQRHLNGIQSDLVHKPLIELLDTRSQHSKASTSPSARLSVDEVEAYLHSIRTQKGQIQIDHKQFARAMDMLTTYGKKYEDRRNLVSRRIQALIDRQKRGPDQKRIQAGYKILAKMMVQSGKARIPGHAPVDLQRVEFPDVSSEVRLWNSLELFRSG